ncbi:hypothetical protein CB1_001815058 [Camelus ferus]|nr:hypothetical protein CB1_001815058 [Camelus ferus]
MSDSNGAVQLLSVQERHVVAFIDCCSLETTAEKSPGAYFLPEFALSPQGSFLEDTTGEQFLTYRYDDQPNALAKLDFMSFLTFAYSGPLALSVCLSCHAQLR